MDNHVYRISAPISAMADIQQLVTDHSGTSSAPQLAASTAEPLNAPISGGDIQAAIQVITVIFSAGTAAAKFIEALLKLARSKKTRIKASNARTKLSRELTHEKDVSDLTG